MKGVNHSDKPGQKDLLKDSPTLQSLNQEMQIPNKNWSLQGIGHYLKIKSSRLSQHYVYLHSDPMLPANISH